MEKMGDELDKKNAELTEELGGTPSREKGVQKEETKNQDTYASVQDYTGEGFKLPNSGNLTEKLASENKEEIIEAVKTFFKNNYNTEVTVHNLAGARDGISVFVESVGEPHFHTLAIVPVSVPGKKILYDQITSLQEEIERDIETGL